MPTVQQIVDRALEHINVKAVGQTSTAEDSELCLRALSSMLDAWQVEPQAVTGLQELVHTPTSGTQVLTIGPAGALVAAMPTRIETASFYRVNGVDVPLTVADSLDEYTAHASKDVQGLPCLVFYQRTDDVGQLFLWPAADGTMELHLWVSQETVTGFSTLTLQTNLTLPNGYRAALEYCLADDVSLSFSVPPPIAMQAARRASLARRKMKRANFKSAQIVMPESLGSLRRYSVVTD